MTVAVSTVYLLDGTNGTGVEAELHDAIEEAQLIDWQAEWQPALMATLQDLARRGLSGSQWPQSRHWDWRAKTAQVRGLLAFRSFSIVCSGVTQGLMRVDLIRSARLPEQRGKPLVHVDYLEVAPWNRPEAGHAPRYRGVGTALVTAAVVLSRNEGFKGRIGLQSLPQADAFYRDHCGMTDLGPDPECQGRLNYFEMTPDQARAFLGEKDRVERSREWWLARARREGGNKFTTETRRTRRISAIG
jgi:hypothetical protein